MEKMKRQIEQKLIAGVIIDKCAHSRTIIFSDAWSTKERVIRFTLPVFRKLFDYKADKSGRWQTGDLIMLEAENSFDSFIVNCVIDIISVPFDKREVKNRLLKQYGINENGEKTAVLKSWDLTPADGKANTLFDIFDRFLQKTVPEFSLEIEETFAKEDEETQFEEGNAETVTSNKYERNPAARAACLAYHGTACAVCGIDFGKVYGPEFAGKIEVHHIVPVSQIGKEYIVDPINNLVPVCPNCHTALHSKPGGVYTVSELKKILHRDS